MDYEITILVIDDSRVMRMTIQVILRKIGFSNFVGVEDRQ